MGEKELIEDLKKLGIEIVKSPMRGYGVKTKRFDSKIELIKECQRLMLSNDYSVESVKRISDFMKENLKTNKEWYKKNKGNIKKIREEAFAKVKKDAEE